MKQNTLILALMLALGGCFDGEHGTTGTNPEATAEDKLESCSIDADGDPCVRSDGLDGVCRFALCMIACDMTAPCPLGGTCRPGECVDGMCLYIGAVNGTSCEAADGPGTCKAGACVQ